MHEALTISRRITRAITVAVISFFLMIWLLHFIPWGGAPDFWGGLELIFRKYAAGSLTYHFFQIWIKAVEFSSTHWKGALEISTASEISLFFAWQVDRFFLRYHTRFLLDATPKN